MNNFKEKLEYIINKKLKNKIIENSDFLNNVKKNSKNNVKNNIKSNLKNNVGDNKKQLFVQKIKISDIKKNPYQPRKIFSNEKINELAESIKNYGIFNPLLLKKCSFGYYIIAGERRFRAAVICNLKIIPAIVINVNDEKMATIGLLENIQRENLTSIEEAYGYELIMKIKNISIVKLSKIIGKSRSHISNILSLLKLPKKIQKYIFDGKVTMGQIKPLVSLKNNDLILKIAEKIISKKLSSRNVENIVRGYYLQSLPKKKHYEFTSMELKPIADLIRKKTNCNVIIVNKTIKIKYRNIKHLNLILKKLKLINSEDKW